MEQEGIATEEVQLGGNKVRGCISCGKCREKNLGHCIFDDDPMNGWIEKMKSADGIIVGSPTYFANVASEMKAFIDRAGYSASSYLYRRLQLQLWWRGEAGRCKPITP